MAEAKAVALGGKTAFAAGDLPAGDGCGGEVVSVVVVVGVEFVGLVGGAFAVACCGLDAVADGEVFEDPFG